MQEHKPHLFIVEDDRGFLESLALEFSDRGFDVTACDSLESLQAQDLSLASHAIIDLRLRQGHGLSAVELLHRASPSCRIVMLTGYPSLATAVQAVKNGAINYLTKPVPLAQLEKALLFSAEEENRKEEDFDSLAKREREYIEYVLNACQGNISATAKKLGLHRQSLQRMLRKYPPRS